MAFLNLPYPTVSYKSILGLIMGPYKKVGLGRLKAWQGLTVRGSEKIALKP